MICDNKIERKTLLYKTGVEYGDYTVNHAEGCSHGCKYPCYAMLMAKRFGKVKTYEDWCKPKIVANALELLDREIPKYRKDINSVHLCFSTDPFMYGYEDICSLSVSILKRLNEAGIRCTVLTKGVLPTELADLSKNNEYGITLVSLNDNFRNEVEPGSAPYADRIDSLRALHEAGMKTWVSIEPYPTPNILEQYFDEILNAVSFVDKIIFGRLNYNALVSQYKGAKEFFNNLSDGVIRFCTERGISYHIKKGTQTNIGKVAADEFRSKLKEAEDVMEKGAELLDANEVLAELRLNYIK